MFKPGDRVIIMDAKKIEGNMGYFKTGDITYITTYKGHVALEHSAEELNGGLVITPKDHRFIDKF